MDDNTYYVRRLEEELGIATSERDRILKELERTLIALTGEATNPVGALNGQYLADAAAKMREDRDAARRTAEYWKAEHLAGNKEIDRLKDAIKRQAAAVRTLDLKERAEYLATQSLDSEREMNAQLTAEVEEWKAKYEALKELAMVASPRRPVEFDWQSK